MISVIGFQLIAIQTKKYFSQNWSVETPLTILSLFCCFIFLKSQSGQRFQVGADRGCNLHQCNQVLRKWLTEQTKT